jgi:glycosyltransferase involved in cell wall biosynthesis
VESALQQTYPRIEVLVVDDGSTDGTPECLARFGETIKLIRQTNLGPSKARNRGVAEASGGIVAFLDSDDVWLPGKLSKQVEVLERGGDRMCCCVTNCTFQNSSGATTTSFAAAAMEQAPDAGVWHNPAEVLSSRFLLFNQVVAIRKQAFFDVGGFHEDLWLLEDHHLALKLAVHGTWGVVGSPEVVKYEEDDGLGRAAREDPVGHLQAVEHVITIFIEEHGSRLSPDLEHMYRKELQRLQVSQYSHRLAASDSRIISSVGGLALLFRRAISAVRRRTCLWPTPVFEEY